MKNFGRVLNVVAVGLLCMVCLLANTAYSAEPELPNGKKWTLVWSDEFDGSKLDESQWTHRVWKAFDGWLVKDAVYLDGKGHLVIKVYEKDGKYYCGMVDTRGKFQHKYGYWEARCRLPKQVGHFPAFWIWSPTIYELTDPGVSGTEIDVMEYHVPMKNTVHHTLHWFVDENGKKHKHVSHAVDIPGVSEGYHTFGVEWTEKEYIFYVDGNVTWRTTKAVSHRDEYVCLSEHIAQWAGKIQDAKLPDFFEVDYVRVYENENHTPKQR